MNSPGHAESDFEIVNRLGMHARAATRLVHLASQFKAVIQLEKDGQCVDGKSVMGVLLLCGEMGAKLRVRADGPDAQAAVDAIGQLIGDHFGEDD